MRAQVEIMFCRMSDVGVDGCSSRNIASSSTLVSLIWAEKSSVVSFLYNYEGDAWPNKQFKYSIDHKNATIKGSIIVWGRDFVV